MKQLGFDQCIKETTAHNGPLIDHICHKRVCPETLTDVVSAYYPDYNVTAAMVPHVT